MQNALFVGVIQSVGNLQADFLDTLPVDGTTAECLRTVAVDGGVLPAGCDAGSRLRVFGGKNRCGSNPWAGQILVPRLDCSSCCGAVVFCGEDGGEPPVHQMQSSFGYRKSRIGLRG